MHVRPAHVQAPPARPREEGGRDEVDRGPRERDREHEPRVDLRRRGQAPCGRVDDPDRRERKRHPVHLRRQHLQPLEAEGPAAGRRAHREPGRDEREAERAGVRQHVPRVGEKCERPRDEPGSELAAEKDDDQGERSRERAPIRA